MDQKQDLEEHAHPEPSSSPAPVEPPKNTSRPTSVDLNQPFSLSVDQLSSFIDPKSITALYRQGGPARIFEQLKSDPTFGIRAKTNQPNDGGSTKRTSDVESQHTSQSAETQHRIEKFGVNQIPTKPTRSFWKLVYLALQDKVLIILMIAAVVSLALGIYTTVGTPPKTFQDANGNFVEEPRLDWVEGCAILIAVAIVTLVGSVNDYQKELQFVKLNEKKEDRYIKVIRKEQGECLISIHDILVGDLVLIDSGDVIPADGIFLTGFEVECDESTVTGESDLIKKLPYEDCLKIALEKQGQGDELQTEVQLGKTDCFMISGSRVVQGYGRYLVTSVGPNSFHGKIMLSLRTDTENTPLQIKLNTLAELIAKLGAAAGLALFIALMIKFFIQLKTQPNRSPNDKAQAFIQVLIISVTVVVVAVPEGLPLAVTLALAFATRRMTKNNLLVRVLSSCETMANATVVCTDKTGTLTQNRMKVVAGSIGVHLKFANLDQNRVVGLMTNRKESEETRSNVKINVTDVDREPTRKSDSSGRLDFSVDQTELGRSIDRSLVELLNQSICLNSTAFEATNAASGQREFIGSKTESALLLLNQEQGWTDYRTIRDRFEILEMIPFSSKRKTMGVIVRSKDDPQAKVRLYLKGASEILSKASSHYVRLKKMDENDVEEAGGQIIRKRFDDQTRSNINRTIIFYANQSLRTIGLCYRDFETWPPAAKTSHLTVDSPLEKTKGEDQPEDVGAHGLSYEDLLGEDGLTLLAVVGIEDPLREGVPQAVADCARAGVAVKMITGDNILTAKSIASQCGIYTPGGIIMEGPIFRQLTKKELIEVVPRLQVLARSSPEDKKKLVNYLKYLGEVCAVTGDGTNDGPALKTANVGFSMGISGTEVAKEASDIILMDDNFSSIVFAIMWGRCVNDSVKKFLQFQLSVNITAVIITFVTSVASNSESSILTAVQLLWVNLIMDTFAALALATDPATEESLDRKPDHKLANLINIEMWKMIIGQSIYQLVVILVLNFAGANILGYSSNPTENELDRNHKQEILKTIVFNCFVFCQIWNMFNARELSRKLNVFKGVFRNRYFMVIFFIMVAGQILIVEVGGAAFQVTRIGARDWAISIIIGLISLPLGTVIKLIPTEPIEKVVYKSGLMKDPKTLEMDIGDPDLIKDEGADEEDEESSHQWNPAIDKVRDNLAIFSQIRGGRMRSSSFVRRSRTYQMQEKGIHTGALMTMVPTLVMTSIGAGWQPKKAEGSLADPASNSPNRSSRMLWSERVEVHPDTAPDDPVVVKFGGGKFEDRHKKMAGGGVKSGERKVKPDESQSTQVDNEEDRGRVRIKTHEEPEPETQQVEVGSSRQPSTDSERPV